MIVTLIEDGDDLILPIPDELIDELGWNTGDMLEWDVQSDHTIILRSQQMKEHDKWNRGLDLFIESVHKPDSKLRACAHNQECFDELMSIRESMLEYLQTLRK